VTCIVDLQLISITKTDKHYPSFDLKWGFAHEDLKIKERLEQSEREKRLACKFVAGRNPEVRCLVGSAM
jgi:hypothetical protein